MVNVLLICRLGQTIDYVSVKTRDPFPQKHCFSDHLKHKKSLDGEHTKSLYSPDVRIWSNRLPKITKILSFRFAQRSTKRNKYAQRKPANPKRHQATKFPN